jgi:hypothetical protein
MGHHAAMTNRDGLLEVTIYGDGVVSPCVVAPSRYGGTYEGGLWVAFPADSVPTGATSGDTVVASWFLKNGWKVGAGADPNAALADLVSRLEAAEATGRVRITRPGA